MDNQDMPPETSKGVSVWWLLLAFGIGVGVGGYFVSGVTTSPGRQPANNKRTATPALPPLPNAKILPDNEHVRHVRPGMDIQDVLEAAAADPAHKVVRVHEGVYCPRQHAQAMIYFNARHDGIRLEAEGEVVLTAANPEIADPTVFNFPAVVNHVVYFGDGITRKTVIRGFKITGAKNFVTTSEKPLIEPAVPLPSMSGKAWIYYADGGGIKIWGRSSPWIDRVEIYDCYTYPCAGAISIDNRGHLAEVPLITNSIFRNNRAQWTGSAIDMFGPGNAGEIRNCLFVGNVANRGYYTEIPIPNHHDQNGSGAVTIFPGSGVIVDHCTFTGNYNGVDDDSVGNDLHELYFLEKRRARRHCSRGARTKWTSSTRLTSITAGSGGAP